MGISQKQLGINAKIDPTVASPRVNQYEKGKHRPDPKMAEKLCEVLGVPVAYLYCEDDDLARVVANFARLNDGDKKKVLALIKKVEDLEP